MAVAVDISMPLGRYCATPWGRHVNEGVVEWPPSPWRIVRALVASWHIHHPDIPQDQVREALDLLCDAPAYQLPRGTLSTTRHYMPSISDKSRARDTDLVLNAFVAVAPGDPIRVFWDSDADRKSVETLAALASTVSYLGRAESRVRIGVSEVDGIPGDCLGPAERGGIGSTPTLDLLVPVPPLDWDSVHLTTSAMLKQRVRTPSSAEWVTYRPPPLHRTISRVQHRPVAGTTQVMQFSVTGRGRPSMSNAVLLAGVFRAAVTSLSPDEPALHGHVGNDALGKQPSESDNQHAHYLAVNDLARGGRVDKLAVWVPQGIPGGAVRRIAELTDLRVPEHLHKRLGSRIPLALDSAGASANLDDRLIGASRRWRTLTPMTTRRHFKRKQSLPEFVSDVVRRELSHRGLPSSPDEVEIRLIPDSEVAGVLQARRLYRARRLGAKNQHFGFHVELAFADPQVGPLVLGSLAHFGSGILVHEPCPCSDQSVGDPP